MPAPRNRLTSKLFWELADRWKMADDVALALLGHESGGATPGKRPRFTLTSDEAHRLTNLLAINRMLLDIAGEPGAWLRRASKSAPFGGLKPLDFMVRNGHEGIDRTRHFLETESFRRSM